MKKIKNKNIQNSPLSPEKYILKRAKSLPIYKCLLNENWKEAGKAIAVVCRKHISGNITAGVFLLDLFAYGVRDTFFIFNATEEEVFEQFENLEVENFRLTEVPYVLVHNIIYGAVDFADEHNMKPHPLFPITSNILEADDEEIEYIDIQFGMNGQPLFIEV